MRRIAALLLALAAVPASAATKEVGPIVSNVVTALTDAATITFDASTAFTYSVTLGGNRVMGNPSSAVAGSLYTVLVTQDGTGSRTLDWSGLWRFPSAVYPLLSTAAGSVDTLVFVSDATYMNYIGVQKNQIPAVIAPGSFACSSDQVGQITFTWTDRSSDETGFTVYDYIGTPVTTTAANATGYVYTVEAGTTYYYVTTRRGAYYSQPSAVVECISLEGG